jgi:hypothetical protein
MAALPTFASEANALASTMTSIASGGAISIPYKFDTATTNADPGAGKLRLSSGTQNTATAIYLDLLGSDNTDYSAVTNTFDASTSATKGYIMLRKAGDVSKWLLFSVTGRAVVSGYRAFNVTYVAGTSASPFALNDNITLQYTPNGDKGDIGATPTQYFTLLQSATIPSGVAYVDFLTVFSSGYDHYMIDLAGVNVSNATSLNFYFVTGGSVVDSSNNYYLGADGASSITPATSFSFGILSASNPSTLTATLEVKNANSASIPKSFSVRGNSNLAIFVKEGVWYVTNAAPTGFRIMPGNSFTFTGGTIKVYGIKNS